MGQKRATTPVAPGTPEAPDNPPVQLRLVDGARPGRPDWVLDARTRRAGRRGVAEARAILERARRAHPAAQGRKQAPPPEGPDSLAS